MQKHEKQIALIIDHTRCGEEGLLHDSKEAAHIIIQYFTYHFDYSEKIKFENDPQH